MPELYTEHVAVENWRPGDVVPTSSLAEPRDMSLVIVSVDVKQRYAYVTTEKTQERGQKPHAFDIGTTKTVVRTRPTTAERHAAKVLDALADLDKNERKARRRLASRRDDIERIVTLDKNLLSGHVAGILIEQETAAIWNVIRDRSLSLLAEVQMLHVALQENENAREAFDLAIEAAPTRIDVVRGVRDYVRKELLRGLRFDSRSTSVPANFGDDMVNQARVDWLDSLQWTVDLLDE